MKKTWKTALAALILGVACFAFAACGISGSYTSENLLGSYSTYSFSGNNVSITIVLLGQKVGTFNGTYELNDDKTQITITFPNSEEGAKDYSGTQSFEQGKDYIVIGSTMLNKN